MSIQRSCCPECGAEGFHMGCTERVISRIKGGRMTKWTKADIDGLVEGMPGGVGPQVFIGDIEHTGTWVDRGDFLRALYLAAGLTAEGAPKPEKVRVWEVWADLVTYSRTDPAGWESVHRIVPGYFIPDGAA